MITTPINLLRKPVLNGTETLERLTRWPSLQRSWVGKQVRIWSNQWCAYWRAGGAGYTTDEAQAGVFSFEDAYQRTKHCGPDKMITYHVTGD